jgi:hypothetical protein
MAVGVWVFTAGARGWIVLAAVAAFAAFDAFLTRKWVKEDALRDSQAAVRSV